MLARIRLSCARGVSRSVSRTLFRSSACKRHRYCTQRCAGAKSHVHATALSTGEKEEVLAPREQKEVFQCRAHM